jgi:hypothetical protein
VLPAASLAVVLTICHRYLSAQAACRNEAVISISAGGLELPDMTTFDRREEGFEKKFALDEEQKFKAEARRNKLLGLWVAEKLGLSGDAPIAYAREVVAAEFEGAGNVIRKVMGDLRAKGVALTEQQLRLKMGELAEQAIAEVKAGI